MADVYFEDIEDLVATLNAGCADILQTDVAPIVEKILQKHIRSDIYGTYTPKPGAWVNGSTYQRRSILSKMIISDMIDNDTLLVTSTASASHSILDGYHFADYQPGAFLQLLETGHMGVWKHGFARPAVSNAEKEVATSRAVEHAISRGLKRVTNT